ncbi:hypothetical protein LZ554_008800 [Drepanopeziza brunnea f. sp. 'monogermtubi']|nr:hypothetical protein LZ554_008800 [Drepanopeziza brunnea f. sp. 'monogermtubi']
MASASRYIDYPTPPRSSSPPMDEHNKSSQRSSYQDRPVHETYFLEAADRPRPSSPNHWDRDAPQKPEYEYLPPQRSYSLKQDQDQYRAAAARSQEYPQQDSKPNYSHTGSSSSNKYYTRPTSPSSQKPRPQQQQTPSRRRSPSPPKTIRLSPRPFYYSPTNPLPTPYNASRPLPRPGLMERLEAKLVSWIRAWVRWCKRHPVTAGVLTCIPVLAGAGLVRAVRKLGLAAGVGGYLKSLFDGRTHKGTETGEGEDKDAEWDDGIGQFAGFAGVKGDPGPLRGILKLLQIGVNHYCRLTSSAVPKLASILLELYFLEAREAKK